MPIATIPGLIAPWVGVDFVLGDFPAAATILRVFLRRTDHIAGDVVTASIRNAPGAGGAGIDVTIADGAAYGTGSGLLSIAAGGLLYLRVSAAGASSMNLSGWLEVEGAAGVTTALTNLARVKEWLGIANSDNDAILSTLIAGVSKRCQMAMDRTILATAIAAELHEGDGADDLLQLRQFPIVSPPAPVVRQLTVAGPVVVDAASYRLLPERGWILRATNGSRTPWPSGRANLEVDYTAGYAAVPEDLAQAATMQVAYLWRQTKAGGNRLGERGTILELGGTAAYLTGEWAPGVLEALLAHRDVRVA
jgi:hypothetical protein